MLPGQRGWSPASGGVQREPRGRWRVASKSVLSPLPLPEMLSLCSVVSAPSAGCPDLGPRHPSPFAWESSQAQGLAGSSLEPGSKVWQGLGPTLPLGVGGGCSPALLALVGLSLQGCSGEGRPQLQASPSSDTRRSLRPGELDTSRSPPPHPPTPSNPVEVEMGLRALS